MNTSVRLFVWVVVCSFVSAPVLAQDTSTPQEVRPAITSFWGDTGLWFVPTGEVLKPGGWAFGAYRTEMDFKQGSTDVSYYPGTLAIGLGGRTEIFAAVRAVTSVDRDTRPLFAPAATGESGVVNEYPLVRQGWTGQNFGDVYVGTKFNLVSEHRRQPMAMALRGTVKLPTAGEDNVGTGQFDYFLDAIFSKELGRRVELSGFGGYALRGDPGGLSLSDGLRWGFGAAFGARSSLRFTTELHGEVPTNDGVVVLPGSLIGIDGSSSPVLTELDSRVNAAAGVTWQHPSGVLLGVGMNYRVGIDGRPEWGCSFASDSTVASGSLRHRRRCRRRRLASSCLRRRHRSRSSRLPSPCRHRRHRQTARLPSVRSAIRVASRSVSPSRFAPPVRTRMATS